MELTVNNRVEAEEKRTKLYKLKPKIVNLSQVHAELKQHPMTMDLARCKTWDEVYAKVLIWNRTDIETINQIMGRKILISFRTRGLKYFHLHDDTLVLDFNWSHLSTNKDYQMTIAKHLNIDMSDEDDAVSMKRSALSLVESDDEDGSDGPTKKRVRM